MIDMDHFDVNDIPESIFMESTNDNFVENCKMELIFNDIFDSDIKYIDELIEKNESIENEKENFNTILNEKLKSENKIEEPNKNTEYNFSTDVKLNTILTTCYNLSFHKDLCSPEKENDANAKTLSQSEDLNPEDKIFWEFCYKRASEFYNKLSE